MRKFINLLLILAVLTGVVFVHANHDKVEAQSSTQSFKVIEDAHVKGESGREEQNYGDESRVIASDWSRNQWIAYLKFDLSSLSGAEITSAVLRVEVKSSRDVDKQVKLVSGSNWSESTITYSNAPTTGIVLGNLSAKVRSGDTVDIPLNPSVLNQIKSGVVSIAIDNVGAGNTFSFASKEDSSSFHPTLIITSSAPTSTPTPTPQPTVAPTPTPSATPLPTQPPASGIVEIRASEDANIKGESGRGDNNYAEENILIASDYSSNLRMSYLKFDLSSVINSTISNVILRVKVKDSRSVDKLIKFVENDSWSENTITYNNAPSRLVTVGELHGDVGQEQTLDIELDANLINNSNTDRFLSLAVDNANEGNTLSFSSKEGDFAPRLIVTTGGATTIKGDTNGDGLVNQIDYDFVISTFGTTNSAADFNGNAVVDIFDLNFVISAMTSPSSTPTPDPTSTPAPTPTAPPPSSPAPTATPAPTPTPGTGSGIGPINLSYKQGGFWLTPDEIAQIPTDNSSWDSLVSYANKSMNIVSEITCTSGSSCSSQTDTPAAMYARAVVGVKTNNQTMINELKSELDLVEQAVNKAIDVDRNLDEKWAERNLGYIGVAANIIDYRPTSLTRGLKKALIDTNFEEGHTIEWHAMNQLPNKPAYGRWSLMATSYLLEDWGRINNIVKAHAKAMGEPNWGGSTNTYKFTLTGLGNDDNWQTIQPGGKSNPIAVMPAGLYYQDHGVGGLWLADQYRSELGPTWPVGFTNYEFEGQAPYNAMAWAAHHLGYQNVFKLGNYAMLRAMIFAYSNHDGKTSWPVDGNDTWQVASLMTWAKGEFGSNLPDYLKPEPNVNIPWPLPVTASGSPGRGMGFMYATHYARLTR